MVAVGTRADRLRRVLAGCALTIFLLTGHAGVDIDGQPSVAEWVVLGIVALALPLAAFSGWVVARMTTNRAQAITSTISVAFCAVSRTISDGAFGLFVRRLRRWPSRWH